jgi:hypothetical protein
MRRERVHGRVRRGMWMELDLDLRSEIVVLRNCHEEEMNDRDSVSNLLADGSVRVCLFLLGEC